MLRRLTLLAGCFLLPASAAHCGGDDFTAGGEGGSTSIGSGGAGGGDAASSTASGSGAACGEADCAPAVPSDWKGPARLFRGDDVPQDGCAGFDEQIVAHVPPLDLEPGCVSCSCPPPEGVTCSVPSVQVFSVANCTTVASTKTPDPNGGCVALGGYGAVVKNSAPSGGGCQPAGGTLHDPVPKWTAEALLCSKPSTETTCASGVCVPQLPGALDGVVCVHREGQDARCPDGFPARQVLYLDVDDERGCNQCNCAPPSGVSCESTITGFETISCDGTSAVIPGDGACHATDGHNFGMKFDAAAASGGTCTPSGGEPVGEATPVGPVTVCCTK